MGWNYSMFNEDGDTKRVSTAPYGVGQEAESWLSAQRRKWYIQGQADYRAGNPRPEFGDDVEADSWNMGWDSDAWSDTHNLGFSVLGKIVAPVVDMLTEEGINR